MEFSHTSVLLNETIDNLNINADGIYVDGTLGGAGHSSVILSHLSARGLLIGIDQDKEAINASKDRLKFNNVKFIHNNFSNIKNVLEDLNIDSIDGAILDLGVSSYQLDNPERGFSYRYDNKLDMRMNQDNELTAEYVVNEYDEMDLYHIIKDYGEDKFAKNIAKHIVSYRKTKRIETTFELVDIIKAAIPRKFQISSGHPAKRTFQAIRIEINNELGILNQAIDDFIDVLKPGGRLCIITFHSLEDRIVKEAFRRNMDPCTCPKDFPVCVCGKVSKGKVITRKPILPTDNEMENNPRSKSAKLRVFEKKNED